MFSICSGEALRPARSSAGSPVGSTLKITKTTALTITSSAAAHATPAGYVAEHRSAGAYGCCQGGERDGPTWR